MAEGFEASHVPQQSRRDKLRILSHQHQQPNLLPYDPSMLQVPPDLLACPIPATSSTLLGFASNRSCTLPDPRSSSSENPSHFQDSNPSFLCTQPDLGSAREWGDSSFGSRNGQGLSLSLSSRVHCHGNDDVQKNHPFELNLDRYGSLAVHGSDKGNGPLGPFTGYSLILRGSRFLKPAQKLLEELTDVGRGMFFAERVSEVDSSLMEGGGGESIGNPDDPHRVGSGDGGELGGKKSRLISLLEEVTPNCSLFLLFFFKSSSLSICITFSFTN